MPSPFLQIPEADYLLSNTLAFAFFDRYPVSNGHTLVVTRREVPDYFACTPEEQAALLSLVEEVKRLLDRTHHPDGYNVGFNAGLAAGQTVMHVHLHVIPRYAGDVEDPRGGVRYVIPSKANYLKTRAQPLTDGEGENHLYPALSPLFPSAQRIDILAAFVQWKGLDLIEWAVRDALSRGAHIRILTGDYLEITQAAALWRLLDWMADPEHATGILQVRVVENSVIRRAFHPKAWLLEGPGFGVAFVGSSNLSGSALSGGVEWNLRVDRDRDPEAWARIHDSFQQRWSDARPLDADWVATYAQRPRRERWISPEVEPAPSLPEPTPLQAAALEALETSRKEGRQRALVVMATGLGKTVLAAWDLQKEAERLGRIPRVLWVAHRKELLLQAAATVRKGLPTARTGWMMGGEPQQPTYDLLFASVQRLSRPQTLSAMDAAQFDYVVIDEVHHADAPSYRAILEKFKPGFLLGLTATPDRGDGGDVAGIFDDHIPYRADVGLGIQAQLLVPFRYFGLVDTTDYRSIPWRNKTFDTEALSAAVETQARMEALWKAWNEPDKRASQTLVFCASIRHAVFVRNWLKEKGQRIALCHAGIGSDDRVESLTKLETGALDAIVSVDLFNEGVDCRPLDRVVMLRPTESPVLFLQQLGRGLRRSIQKTSLVVIDFVGNHRIFLDRLSTLLSMGGTAPSLTEYFRSQYAVLPQGCSVNLELEAIDLLRRLMPASGSSLFVRNYQEIRAVRGERPRAGEMVRQEYGLENLHKLRQSWFGFVRDQQDFSSEEEEAWTIGSRWLEELERTPMTRCFKMVVLEVLLEADALLEGMDLADLAARSHAYLLRNPELFEDLVGLKEFPDPHTITASRWAAYWKKNPVNAWNHGWFAVDGARFVSLLPRHPEKAEITERLVEMTRELVDARLAEYRRRKRNLSPGRTPPAR